MKKLRSILLICALPLSFSLMGCSNNSESNTTPAVFDTRKEAIKAAKDFNCTGAHRMGDKWMPCKSHEAHEERLKDKKHGGKHKHNH